MSPNEIEMLIHFHTSGTPHPRQSSPAVSGSTAWMLEMDLIRKIPSDTCDGAVMAYATTDRGAAMVKMICDTPIPQARFVDPRNGEIL